MRRVTLFVILCSLAIPATASSATQLFRDDFNTLSPNWIKRNSCPNDVTAKGWLCYNPKNVWVSGGKLYLQHSEGTMGRPYDGSMVATYKHGWGWPATNVRRTWPAPVLIEASIKFSGESMAFGRRSWPGQRISANLTSLTSPNCEAPRKVWISVQFTETR